MVGKNLIVFGVVCLCLAGVILLLQHPSTSVINVIAGEVIAQTVVVKTYTAHYAVKGLGVNVVLPTWCTLFLTSAHLLVPE